MVAAAKSQTDPERLPEALKRAAEMAGAKGWCPHHPGCNEPCEYLAGCVQAVKALRVQYDKAKWAWQFLAAVASDGHNREHDGRAVALAECPGAPCPGWREDLQSYQDAIADSDAAIAAFCDAMLGEEAESC